MWEGENVLYGKNARFQMKTGLVYWVCVLIAFIHAESWGKNCYGTFFEKRHENVPHFTIYRTGNKLPQSRNFEAERGRAARHKDSNELT